VAFAQTGVNVRVRTNSLAATDVPLVSIFFAIELLAAFE
jgi:hypothetical protein